MNEGLYLLIQGPRTAMRVCLPEIGTLSVGSSPKCEVQLREPVVAGELARIALDPQIGVTIMHGYAEMRAASGTRRVSPGDIVEVQPKDILRFESVELTFTTDPPKTATRRIWSRSHLAQVVQDRLRAGELCSIAWIKGPAMDADRFLETVSDALQERDIIGNEDEGVYALVLVGSEREARTTMQELGAKLGPDRPIQYGLVPADGQDATALLDAAKKQSRQAPGEDPPAGLREEMAALERRRILEALDTHPTQSAAAKALRVPLRTFVNRMDALGIPRPRKKE